MKADVIYKDSTLRVKARIRNIDGDLTDPQTITFELKKPNDSDYSVYTTTSLPVITHESTGIYYIDLDIDAIGKWKYSWFTTGTVTSSLKGFFQVEDSRYP